jgi:hypothetical protein
MLEALRRGEERDGVCGTLEIIVDSGVCPLLNLSFVNVWCRQDSPRPYMAVCTLQRECFK